MAAAYFNGTDGDDTLEGTRNDDTFTGSAGNDILRGSYGNDTFIFEIGNGVDHILDYNAAHDTIQFTGLLYSDLTISQSGSSVLIEYGSGDLLILENVSLADFGEPEFLFV